MKEEILKWLRAKGVGHSFSPQELATQFVRDNLDYEFDEVEDAVWNLIRSQELKQSEWGCYGLPTQ